MFNETGNSRLLVLTSTFPRWKNDVEPPFVYELCRRLASKGFSVDVLAPHTPGSKTFEHLHELKVYRYRYFFERYQKLAYDGGIMASLKENKWLYLLVPFFLASQLFHTWKLFKRGNYSLIHAHWIIPQGLIAAMAVTMTGKKNLPIVCISHGGDLFSLDSFFFKWLKLWALRRMTLLTVVSEHMKNHCQEHLGVDTGIEVCSMGVDLAETFTPPAKELDRQQRLIFVGRLVEGKGLYDLLHALRKLRDKRSDMHLDVLGEGPERNGIMEEIKRLDLANHVTLHGAVGNLAVPDYLRRSAIAVIPSRGQEGLGLVAIEAMGCECAVVASSFDAIRDVITDGENGLLFPAGDAEALSEKIHLLLEDTALQRKLAISGRQNVLARYDWRVIAEKYARLSKKLISG